MRHGLATTWFAISATLASGHWSTVDADSFKIVTAPTGTGPVQPNAGSSFKVVTVPVNVNQAQAQPRAVPHADEEPLPSGSATEPVTQEPQKSGGVQRPGNYVPREQTLLPPNTERQIFSPTFTKVIVSDPEVLGLLPISGQTVVLKALKTGNTDVLFFNNDNLVKSIEVVVNNSVVRGNAVPDREAHLPAFVRVEIHNKALLTSQTNFSCGPDGCHYVDEVTVTEPAPLPRGWSNQTVTSAGGQGAPQVTVPAAPAR